MIFHEIHDFVIYNNFFYTSRIINFMLIVRCRIYFRDFDFNVSICVYVCYLDFTCVTHIF